MNRGGLFALEKHQLNTLAPRKRPLRTVIPAFMEKGETKIGFGIMGGWNQGQAHAQFVSNIVDHGFTIERVRLRPGGDGRARRRALRRV